MLPGTQARAPMGMYITVWETEGKGSNTGGSFVQIFIGFCSETGTVLGTAGGSMNETQSLPRGSEEINLILQ